MTPPVGPSVCPPPWSFQLPEVTPPSLAPPLASSSHGGRLSATARLALRRRSIPRPGRPGIALRPLREDKSAEAESTFSMTRRCCIIIGNSSQLPKKAAPTWSHPLPPCPLTATLEELQWPLAKSAVLLRCWLHRQMSTDWIRRFTLSDLPSSHPFLPAATDLA